ncbi:MAG: calcium/sodium antiporter [Chloroflexaceae bacterium]|nr:calcium/sodium antiporter [Chloroflexaceae bacterium]
MGSNFGTSCARTGRIGGRRQSDGQPDIALGNVVGSNIANVLLILGISALAAPLLVSPQIRRFDLPLMLAVSVLLIVLSLDGTLGTIDGTMLVIGIITYTVWSVYKSRRDEKAAEAENAAVQPGDHQKPASSTPWYLNLVFVVVGLGMLVLGARWIVDGATSFARAFDVSELIIGLTIVAVGTSLPEIAISVLASMRGHRDIAVGNVVGSNIFNILSVLGVAAITAPGGIPIPASALSFDMPVMLLVALACVPIFFTGSEIARWEGGLFLAYYVAYTLYLVLIAVGSSFLPLYTTILLGAVVLTVLLLVGMMARAMLSSRQRTA